MSSHTHERRATYTYMKRKVVFHVLAYKPITDRFFKSCINEWLRKQRGRRLLKDIVVTFPSSYGWKKPPVRKPPA